jgi:hypothetical protein
LSDTRLNARRWAEKCQKTPILLRPKRRQQIPQQLTRINYIGGALPVDCKLSKDNSPPVCSQLQMGGDRVAERGGEDQRSALSPRTSVCDVRGNLRTPFKTSEPEGVRNAKNQIRTGAGEIGRTKITPTFRTLLDGLGI